MLHEYTWNSWSTQVQKFVKQFVRHHLIFSAMNLATNESPKVCFAKRTDKVKTNRNTIKNSVSYYD